MKRRYLLLACLGVVIVAGVVVVFSGRSSGPTVTLRIQSVTNDAAGQRVAVMSLTKHKTVVVLPDSFACKVGDEWIWQPFPTNRVAELDLLTNFSFLKQGTRPAIGAVHFPTNSPWRLRLEVVEPRSGIDGLIERLKYPTGFYRKGGILNVVFGHKPSRYTGKAYYVESEEIR